jgi:PPOX class probable F420-dependent enzyme
VPHLSPRARAFIDSAPVARLATVSSDGELYPVPICFVALDDETNLRVYSVVDEKPKRTTNLKRVRNIDETGRAAIIVDHYDDDWTQLGWVQLRGGATLIHDPGEHAEALALLRARYPQYETMTLEESPLFRIDITHATEWWASPQ